VLAGAQNSVHRGAAHLKQFGYFADWGACAGQRLGVRDLGGVKGGRAAAHAAASA
jgi:hypothetical protein